MDTDKIKYILSLFDDGIITHTAQKNFITQSSLTKLIKSWETEYNCTLLVRSKKGVAFTKEGELFVEFCRNVLELQENFKNDISSSKSKIRGNLAVGASLGYTRYFFPSFLKKFAKNNRDINIYITDAHSDKLYDYLVDKKIDVAILRGEFKWFGKSYLLSSEHMCLISTKPLTLQNLLPENYIGHKSDSDIQFSIDKWSFENKIDTSKAKMWISDINACEEIVQSGLGWSILPEICLKDFRGYVKPLYFKDKTPITRNTYALVSPAKAALPVVKVFMDGLLAYHKISK